MSGLRWAPFEGCSQSQRHGIIAGAFVVFGFVAHWMRSDAKEMKGRGSGIVTFELADLDDTAAAILTNWGPTGRAAARRHLLLDVPFIAAYSIGLGTLITSAVAAAVSKSWAWSVWTTRALAWTAIFAGVCDLVENVCLWRVIRRLDEVPLRPLSPWRSTARAIAVVKFGLLIGCAGWLLLFVIPLVVAG